MDAGVACDRCGDDFITQLVEVDDDAGGISAQFVCPHCGAVYEAYRIDRVGLRLRKRLYRATTPKATRKLLARLRDRTTKGAGLLPQ